MSHNETHHFPNAASRIPHTTHLIPIFALRPAPSALRPDPCALSPAPCALRPEPCALRYTDRSIFQTNALMPTSVLIESIFSTFWRRPST
jgi:hypothetical protein